MDYIRDFDFSLIDWFSIRFNDISEVASYWATLYGPSLYILTQDVVKQVSMNCFVIQERAKIRKSWNRLVARIRLRKCHVLQTYKNIRRVT